MSKRRIDDSRAPSRRLARFWESVGAMIPGAFVTEEEAIAFVAGTLSADRKAMVERLLEETPELARELSELREEFDAYYGGGKWEEVVKRFGKALPELP